MRSFVARPSTGLWIVAALVCLVFLGSCAAGPTDAPVTIDPIPDQRTTRAEPIDVAIALGDEKPDTVLLAATSGNPELVTDTGLAFDGSGATRSLRITPDPERVGSATITVTARDEASQDTTVDFDLLVERPFQALPAKLTAADGAAGDGFGHAVAIDGSTALIGAFLEDDAGENAGAAYLFERTDGGWIGAGKLTASVGMPGDQFGYAVAIDGDVAVVGAHLDATRGSSAGAAYVYERTDGAWTELPKLTASDGDTIARFGAAVAISGDDVLVGAPGDNEDGNQVGAAYLYQRTDVGWVELHKLTPNDGARGARFGHAVAIDGDYALIGAWGADAAYLFHRTDIGWIQLPKLTATGGTPGDGFGYAVAIDGDQALIGAWADGDRGSEAGAAYVYRRTGTAWSSVKLVASDGAAYDYFGISVALDGDYALVGAYGATNDEGTGTGAAYLHQRIGGTWHAVKLAPSDGEAIDYVGEFVALDDPYALIGAHGDDGLGSGAGAAYLHER